MIDIDSYYDTALRSIVTNEEFYDAGGKNLHLIGCGMDNAAAELAEEAIKMHEYKEYVAFIFGFGA